MMREIVRVYVLVGIFLSIGCGGPVENKALIDDINAKWNARNYGGIKQIIDTRLQANPSDVLGLSLKQFYYILAEPDVARARQAATTLKGIVETSSNQEIRELGTFLVNAVLNSVPAGSTIQYNATERDSIHRNQEYPFLDKCMVLWGLHTGQLN